MDTITTIGLDIAKSVFQVHGIDAAGNPVVRRQLKRRRRLRVVKDFERVAAWSWQPCVRSTLANKQMPCSVISFFGKLEPCLVGIEACASSHHWARELMALGHDVRLMPPAYVKPYVKRHKNDAMDAEAICEAVQRPSMRFVPVKTPEQQAGLMWAVAQASLPIRQGSSLEKNTSTCARRSLRLKAFPPSAVVP